MRLRLSLLLWEELDSRELDLNALHEHKNVMKVRQLELALTLCQAYHFVV